MQPLRSISPTSFFPAITIHSKRRSTYQFHLPLNPQPSSIIHSPSTTSYILCPHLLPLAHPPTTSWLIPRSICHGPNSALDVLYPTASFVPFHRTISQTLFATSPVIRYNHIQKLLQSVPCYSVFVNTVAIILTTNSSSK